MCDCRQEIREADHWVNDAGEKATSVNVPIQFVQIGRKLIGQTYTPIEVSYPNRKRPIKVAMAHTFCPWCAERILPEQEGGVAP